jgi:hypothetical protein
VLLVWWLDSWVWKANGDWFFFLLYFLFWYQCSTMFFFFISFFTIDFWWYHTSIGLSRSQVPGYRFRV